MNLIVFLLIGGIAGWLAGLTSRGQGWGPFGNVVLGVLGAFAGSFLFRILNLPTEGLVMSMVAAFLGAVAILMLASLVRRPF